MKIKYTVIDSPVIQLLVPHHKDKCLLVIGKLIKGDEFIEVEKKLISMGIGYVKFPDANLRNTYMVMGVTLGIIQYQGNLHISIGWTSDNKISYEEFMNSKIIFKYENQL